MKNIILQAPAGSKHLLLGNEAIVRGAIEAGVGFVSCYPGTPSSEVPDTFYKLSKEGDFYFEYSVNEKVALEVGGGAALGGIPTLVTMKHVGVNVAADPLMSLAYIGTPGGLVLLSADDPGCHSSQNEQDNRYYARLAGLPCFEPATAQEAKDMTKEALILSRKWEQPVMLRTTTRINHLRGVVVFGEKLEVPKPNFPRDPFRFVPLPAVARKRHPVLLKNLEKIKKEIESHPFNKTNFKTKKGIIASGISRAYLLDVLTDLGATSEVSLLELGITYPTPETLILDFVSRMEEVLVLEELEPILENEIRIICQKNGLKTKIYGKDENLTRLLEYSTRKIEKAVLKFLDKPKKTVELCKSEEDLPGRPPNLCAGCPHRAVYYSVRKIFGDNAIYATDIGCYTLGFLPPHRACDFLFCMGSSISGGSGMARATGKTVIGYIEILHSFTLELLDLSMQYITITTSW
jgi:indolepyruvate ferredoxin oxidoreductase alpha subunit